MKCECKDWIPTEIDYKITDWAGQAVTLKDVPAESCPKCNAIRVDSDSLLRMEQKHIADEKGITPLELSVLLLLEASPPIHAKYPHRINDRYRMNKMLFYVWKRMEEKGFGESWIHDVFKSDRRGPVPVHLNETIRRLENLKIVKVQHGGKAFRRPFVYELTSDGEKVADTLWEKVPETFREVFDSVKKDLMFLDTNQLKTKVHKEYPDYKATYVEPDTDD